MNSHYLDNLGLRFFRDTHRDNKNKLLEFNILHSDPNLIFPLEVTRSPRIPRVSILGQVA